MATIGGEPHRNASLFALETIASDHFRLPANPNGMPRLYGGQVFAQALAAAQATVGEDRLVHSAHAYFIRAGDTGTPLDLHVERDSDGRSFSARRVLVRQDGRLILSLSASMHVAEQGAEHQFAMPDVAAPDALDDLYHVIAALGDRLPARQQAFWLRDTGYDMRSVEPLVTFDPPPQPPRRHIWLRLREAIGDAAAEHQRLLAFISDLYVMHTGLLPAAIGWADPKLQDASLDHAIWFHAPFRIDEWLLYAMDSPRAGGGRTIGRGLIYRQDGTLVASVVQEGLIRLRD